MRNTIKFLLDNSLFLIMGAVGGLIWANLDHDSYHHFVEYPLWDHAPIGHAHADAEGHVHRTLTVHYLINDVLMALFFAIAAKANLSVRTEGQPAEKADRR